MFLRPISRPLVFGGAALGIALAMAACTIEETDGGSSSSSGAGGGTGGGGGMADTGGPPGSACWEDSDCLGGICWTLAYDTIYAMVDRDDDLKVGV